MAFSLLPIKAGRSFSVPRSLCRSRVVLTTAEKFLFSSQKQQPCCVLQIRGKSSSIIRMNGSSSGESIQKSQTADKDSTTKSREKQKIETADIPKVDWRPMTIGERIRHFPSAVKQLYKDCCLYKNIHDASRTRLNAWTVDHPFRQDKPVRAFHIYEDEIRPGRIPRRQHEQQRRLYSDVMTDLPILLIWVLPIIGYLPMILAATAPRQVLSRQFHNEYEIQHYDQLEYQQRQAAFTNLAKLFWNATTLGHKQAADLEIVVESHDAAGPVMDALPLYSIFAHGAGASHEFHLRRGALSSLDVYPSRDYLVQFSLAIGVNQHFPRAISPIVTRLCPSAWLRFKVREIAKVVAEDDSLLLTEGHDENGCASLTDLEVMDACLMRGLPIVDVSYDEMRVCLTNHLNMIASVKERVPYGPMTEGFGIFTLHLAIIRDFFRKHKKQPS